MFVGIDNEVMGFILRLWLYFIKNQKMNKIFEALPFPVQDEGNAEC